jgi:DNA repair ATPase RecN
MTRPPKKGPEYSREREWGVILEDLQSQFRVFGEGLGDVRGRLERVEEKLEKLDLIENRLGAVEYRLKNVETILRPFTAQVSDHEHRITSLERSR